VDDDEPLYLYSSATFIERETGCFAFAIDVFRVEADLDPETISTPVEVLFVSVVPKTELILPPVNVKVCFGAERSR
jgi:hypothetical protein